MSVLMTARFTAQNSSDKLIFSLSDPLQTIIIAQIRDEIILGIPIGPMEFP